MPTKMNDSNIFVTRLNVALQCHA